MDSSLIICIVAISVALLIGIGYLVYVKVFKKKKLPLETRETSKSDPEIEIVTIQLNGIKLLKGSNLLGYETIKELRARIEKLSLEEFKALNVEGKPWSVDDWNTEVESVRERGEDEEDLITARNLYEIEHMFIYNYDGSLDEKKAEALKRVFEVKK